jgi:hypothetical protein
VLKKWNKDEKKWKKKNVLEENTGVRLEGPCSQGMAQTKICRFGATIPKTKSTPYLYSSIRCASRRIITVFAAQAEE